jgi:hypothetical protein
MTYPNNNDWEIVAGVTTIAAVAGVALWLVMRRRPSAEEIERARRQFLVQSGRLVDGMLLDVYDVAGADGHALTFLLFSYRIGGVDYECSQEITTMSDIVNTAEVRAGFPCTVRYQPGNPYNSIVVAEGWTGLRAGLPQFPSIDDPDPIDRSHLEPGAH